MVQEVSGDLGGTKDRANTELTNVWAVSQI